MKKLILIINCFTFVCMLISTNIKAQLPPDNKNYKIVFQDEFDSLGVDSINKWSRADWHSQWWRYDTANCNIFLDHRTNSPHNISFDTTGSGKVTLTARRENPPLYFWVADECADTSGYHAFDYTSPAWFESYRKFKYGYFEIRCRIPQIDTTSYTIRGIGPNFWLYRGIQGGTPNWSEIDIFEYYNKTYHNPGPPPSDITYSSPFFASCSHYQEYPNDYINHWSSSSTKHLNNSGNYHKYAAWWSPNKIEYYYDDQLFFTTIEKQDSMAAQAIILDINIFNYAPYNPIPSSLFPFNYDIDYVKAYQLRQRCNTDTSFCSFNPSTFNFALYKTITFGDGSCNLTINSGSPLVFLSTDGFTLNPGTEITAGTEATFDFDDCQPDPATKSSEQCLPVLMYRESVKGH